MQSPTVIDSRLARGDQLEYARDVIELEARALRSLATRLGESFCDAVELVLATRGSVIVTGVGKAGLIGRKLAATFASTGTPSYFMHAAEAMHGDLGCIRGDDCIVILSQSGETPEIVELLSPLEQRGVRTIAVTGSAENGLAKAVDVALVLGPLQEACIWGLAPSTSTTAMAALGDALALVVSRMKSFTPEDFAKSHPGGSLGRKLTAVESRMRPVHDCRIAAESRTVREVFVHESLPGRRSGAIMLVDGDGRLTGIFTDSDLARLFERRSDESLDRPVRDVMTPSPATCIAGASLEDAIEIMAERKISELPVVNQEGRPMGMLDITDVLVSAGSLRATQNFSAAQGGGNDRTVAIKLADFS